MNSKIFYTLCFLLFIKMTAFGQDKLYKKGEKKPIEVKIIEVGIDEIKYRFYNDPESPIFTIEKTEVNKIVYKNGVEDKFEDELAIGPADFETMHKNILKFSFFSPFKGHSHFTFERYLKQGMSYELDLSIIGLGKARERSIYTYGNVKSYPENNKGAIIGGGMKFLILGSKYRRGEKLMHSLQGTFIRPKLYLGFYSRDFYEAGRDANNYFILLKTKQNITFGDIMVELGRQWVFSDRMSMEIYGGLGYCFNTYKQPANETINIDYIEQSLEESNHFIANRFNTEDNMSFSMNFGFKLGYVFNLKKDIKK